MVRRSLRRPSGGERRVIVVTHEASRTGAPRVAAQLASALRSGGWNTVLLARWDGPRRDEFRVAADRFVLEPGRRTRVVLRRFRPSKSLAVRWEEWVISRVLARLAPDLVWCNTTFSAAWVRPALDRGIPVVLYSHEPEELARPALTRYGWAGSGATGVTLVGCARDSARALAEVWGVPVSDVGLVHSPVDVAGIRSRAGLDPGGEDRVEPTPGERPVVLGCGVGNAVKGVDVFADAARRHAETGGNAEWSWLGRHPGTEQEGPVVYLGERDDAVPTLAGAAVLALPSRRDPFPLVVLEAMALGVPVVASDLPGTREQVDGTGVLVPVGDPAALAAAVSAVLSDPRRAHERVRAALARCRELWDLPGFTARALSVSEEACGER